MKLAIAIAIFASLSLCVSVAEGFSVYDYHGHWVQQTSSSFEKLDVFCAVTSPKAQIIRCRFSSSKREPFYNDFNANNYSIVNHRSRDIKGELIENGKTIVWYKSPPTRYYTAWTRPTALGKSWRKRICETTCDVVIGKAGGEIDTTIGCVEFGGVVETTCILAALGPEDIIGDIFCTGLAATFTISCKAAISTGAKFTANVCKQKVCGKF